MYTVSESHLLTAFSNDPSRYHVSLNVKIKIKDRVRQSSTTSVVTRYNKCFSLHHFTASVSYTSCVLLSSRGGNLSLEPSIRRASVRVRRRRRCRDETQKKLRDCGALGRYEFVLRRRRGRPKRQTDEKNGAIIGCGCSFDAPFQ